MVEFIYQKIEWKTKLFTIAGRYHYDEDGFGEGSQEPYIQKARVVSTIVFFLE